MASFLPQRFRMFLSVHIQPNMKAKGNVIMVVQIQTAAKVTKGTPMKMMIKPQNL